MGINLKSLKVEERHLKQNSLSFESHSVRDFSNVMWETVPCRRSCIGKASLAEFDMFSVASVTFESVLHLLML